VSGVSLAGVRYLAVVGEAQRRGDLGVVPPPPGVVVLAGWLPAETRHGQGWLTAPLGGAVAAQQRITDALKSADILAALDHVPARCAMWRVALGLQPPQVLAVLALGHGVLR